MGFDKPWMCPRLTIECACQCEESVVTLYIDPTRVSIGQNTVALGVFAVGRPIVDPGCHVMPRYIARVIQQVRVERGRWILARVKYRCVVLAWCTLICLGIRQGERCRSQVGLLSHLNCLCAIVTLSRTASNDM